MSNHKWIGLLLFFCCSSTVLHTQTPTTERTATIVTETRDQGIQFKARVPELIQVPGAPPAYWLYHWEFGDGCFSSEAEPLHAYESAGSYAVRLALTAVYDDGDDLPPAKTQTGVVTAQAVHRPLPNDNWVKPEKALRLNNFQLPIPGKEMDLTFTYKNRSDATAHGRLFVFFNERAHEAELFVVDEVRTHHDETEMTPAGNDLGATTVFRDTWASAQATGTTATDDILYYPAVADPAIDAAKSQYANYREWLFADLAPGEERSFFVTFDCTEAMLVDTNELVTLHGIYLADNGNKDTVTLEMPIRDSHDPNLITVSDNRESFRGFKNNKLSYRVQFQNEGDREAREVIIKCTLPAGMDAASVNVLETSPELPRCDEVATGLGCLRDTILPDGSVRFTFDGIYLAGTKQPGVTDKDSTIGFIEYEIRASRKVRKKTLVSRADIIFDNNEVIQTNFATTKFKTGWSIGIKAGLEVPGADCTEGGIFGGLTYSAFQPYNWYWQPEVMYFGGGQSNQEVLVGSGIFMDGDVEILRDTFTLQRSQCNRLDVIPLQFRKNVNDFIGIGAGAQFSIERCDIVVLEQYYEETIAGSDPSVKPVDGFVPSMRTDTRIRPAVFLDLNLGLARLGPSLGARYLYDFRGYDCIDEQASVWQRHTYLQLYAIWRI